MPRETSIVTELLYVNAFERSPGFTIPPHLHHFHQFDVVVTGDFAARVEERHTMLLRAGDG
jgi:hypothetical protein